MRSRIFSTIVLIVCCCCYNMFTSCKSSTEPKALDLLSTLWTLESFHIEGNVIKPQHEQIYNVRFKEGGTFTGINDCNDFGGEYRIERENSMIILSVGGSKMYCRDSKFLDYLEAFRTAKSYKIHKNWLYIYYGDNSKLIFYSE